MKVYKFSAQWCAPCRTYAPIFGEWAETVDIETEAIDIDEKKDFASQYGIRSIPATVLIDDNGDRVKSQTGVMTATELDEFISDL